MIFLSRRARPADGLPAVDDAGILAVAAVVAVGRYRFLDSGLRHRSGVSARACTVVVAAGSTEVRLARTQSVERTVLDIARSVVVPVGTDSRAPSPDGPLRR